MDPLKQVTEPVAEVRRQATQAVDEFGESWVVIDGVETKIPSIAAAEALLVKQDAVRLKIRADLDALGVRDRLETTEIEIDGEMVEVGLLPPGDDNANVLQIGDFTDERHLGKNIAKLEAEYQRGLNSAPPRKKPWFPRLLRKLLGGT